MKDNLIRNVVGCGLVIVLLSACDPETVQQTPIIETRVVEERRPAPIVPSVDQVQMRSVNWVVITPENATEVFENMTGDQVLFAVTSDGYENVALNLSDIRALLQQQQQIIAIYENSYRR